MRNEGEKCEHVCVRGRLMRMQRVEFSIRQFPPSPPLSYSLLALDRKVSFQRFCFFPGCEFTDGQLCCSRLDYSTSITGALFRPGSRLPLSTGRSGLFFHGCWDQGVTLTHLLKRGNVQKVERQETKGSGEAPAERRMVMPAPRVLDVLLLYRLRGVQTQPRLSST